jgi:hypothetical protein
VDINRDGKTDVIQLRARMPLLQTDTVNHISAIFMFDYKLQLQSRLQMQCAIIVEQMSVLPARVVTLTGDMMFKVCAIHYFTK